MIWPEKPTCHQMMISSVHTQSLIWNPRDGQRVCGYCGSLHPEDLMHILQNGGSLQGSDWKYGWPHKFYVLGVPNPNAGQAVPSYVYCGVRERLGPNAEPAPDGGWREKIGEYSEPTTLQMKWYNEHLLDAGYDEETLNALIEHLYRFSRIRFTVDHETEGLGYAAPYIGYQA